MSLTRRKIRALLLDVLCLQLSIGSLQNTLLESARALEPVE